MAAPSLSQLMHNRETVTGPVAVPSLDEEKEAVFDWDRELRVSERARQALEFMRVAMEKYGNAGQPLWPVVPSSLYGAFLAGEKRDARILVITFDASVHGWAAVLRTSPDEPGIEVVGGYRTAVDLLGSAFINPAALPDCPVAQVYRETLAGLLATKAASKLYPLADHTVLIRSDCLGAISALRKGSFRSPALQNIALLHNRLFMDVDAAPQLYPHVPGVVMKAEGVSRSAARAHRASESIDGCAEANRDVRGGGAPGRSHLAGSLRDCRDNTLVPRFFALYPEPLAKGADALAQLDWGRSRCQHCGQLHRECAFAFPPRGLLAPSWPRRAQTASVVSSWSPSRRRTRRDQRSRQRPARPLSVSGTRASWCLIRGSTRARATPSTGRSAWRSWPWPSAGARSFAGVAAPCAVRPPSRVACVAAAPRRARRGGLAPRRRSAFAPRPTGPQAAARWPGLVDTRTGAIYASYPPV